MHYTHHVHVECIALTKCSFQQKKTASLQLSDLVEGISCPSAPQRAQKTTVRQRDNPLLMHIFDSNYFAGKEVFNLKVVSVSVTVGHQLCVYYVGIE